VNSPLLIIGTIAVIVHVLGIANAAHAVMSVRSSRGAIAWSMSLITFPWLALPLYWVFGRRQFFGYTETVRSAYLANFSLVSQVSRQLRAYRGETPAELQVWERLVTKLVPIAFTTNNQIELLINGERAYQAMLTAIESAQDYILLQSYIVHADRIGNAFRQTLIKKAMQGVQVYLLYDGIGSNRLSRRYIRSLSDSGVRVEKFISTRGWRSRFQLNFRNHRKILVVDGKRAFTGGLNIGDEYLGKCPPLTPWRDTAIGLRGATVQILQAVFLSDWYWVTGELPPTHWQIESAGLHQACVFPTSPADRFPACQLAFVSAIERAVKRLWIASPYFVPDDSTINALKSAALRGVDVRIILPDRPDRWLVYLCAFSYYTEMLTAGVKIYRYIPGFMHQKVILIDRCLGGVGTVNLDNRSFFLNFEVTVWFTTPDLLAQLEEVLAADLARSRCVSIAEYETKPLGFKLGTRIARLLTPVL
jgi:cardiolipin synthase